MQLLSSGTSALAFFVAATAVCPLAVRSFQPVVPIVSRPKTTLPFRGGGPIRVLASPDNGITDEAAPVEPGIPAEFLSVPIAVATSDEVAAAAASVELPARTMDEWIYDFNKILIDTVYDVICFLYPVKGNERDFARFYVLETVARVPYFAYLSVMHFRETFGERYDSMSERCVC